MLFRSFAISAILGFGLLGSTLADDSAKQPQAAGQQSAPAPAGEAAPGSPTSTAESAGKGALKSPYPDFAKVDDTLFRLVALGSDGLKKQGYSRKGSENVVGPMPAMGGVVKSEDDLWKIIAWIRSVNPSSAS
jgi:hypothetical protein